MKRKSNPASTPFSITPDADDYLRNRLDKLPPESQPVLVMTESQTDGLKPPRWSYEGQSFIIDCFDSDETTEVGYPESEISGRRVAIESNALRQLSGLTLCLRRVAASRGVMKVARYVLVAESVPDIPGALFETGISPERTKRLLSIAALTILGGFTGMGAAWIASVIVVSLLKSPFEKLLPLTLPLLAIGWIVGAFVSFGFFRSLFKTGGGTKFSQEQKQRRYLGYGGLEAELNWWVFLGIPLPLTGLLVFSIERFAHTVGEKSGVAVGAIAVTFAASMYFCDRIPRRLVSRLGLLGWALTFALGFWYFKTHGP